MQSCPGHGRTEAPRWKRVADHTGGASWAAGSSEHLSPATTVATKDSGAPAHLPAMKTDVSEPHLPSGLAAASEERCISSPDHTPSPWELDVAAFVGTFPLVPHGIPGGPSLPPQPAQLQFPAPTTKLPCGLVRSQEDPVQVGWGGPAAELGSEVWQGLCAPSHYCPWSPSIPPATPAQARAQGTHTYSMANPDTGQCESASPCTHVHATGTQAGQGLHVYTHTASTHSTGKNMHTHVSSRPGQ